MGMRGSGQADKGPKPQLGPPRRAWPVDFPAVTVLADEKRRDAHASFAAAKAGDEAAAARLVDELMPTPPLLRLSQAMGDVVLLPVHAVEKDGINRVPSAMAARIAKVTGLPVENGVIQTNIAAHTRTDGFTRLARPVKFAGTITPGRRYLLVDDHLGMGGTLADLRAFIEDQGGEVAGAVTLSASRGNAILALRPETLAALRARHGKLLEELWRDEFGYGLDALTDPEAGYLGRAASVDAIRDRLAASRPQGQPRAVDADGVGQVDLRHSGREEAPQEAGAPPLTPPKKSAQP